MYEMGDLISSVSVLKKNQRPLTLRFWIVFACPHKKAIVTEHGIIFLREHAYLLISNTAT